MIGHSSVFRGGIVSPLVKQFTKLAVLPMPQLYEEEGLNAQWMAKFRGNSSLVGVRGYIVVVATCRLSTVSASGSGNSAR